MEQSKSTLFLNYWNKQSAEYRAYYSFFDLYEAFKAGWEAHCKSKEIQIMDVVENIQV